MTVRTKTLLIIVGTFLIGIIIGALINGAVIQHRQKRIASIRVSKGFARAIERIVEPDATQREAVRKILTEKFQRIAEIRSRYHAEISAIMDSVQKELAPILTEEQRTRLAEKIERIKKGRRDRRHEKGRRDRHYPRERQERP